VLLSNSTFLCTGRVRGKPTEESIREKRPAVCMIGIMEMEACDSVDTTSTTVAPSSLRELPNQKHCGLQQEDESEIVEPPPPIVNSGYDNRDSTVLQPWKTSLHPHHSNGTMMMKNSEFNSSRTTDTEPKDSATTTTTATAAISHLLLLPPPQSTTTIVRYAMTTVAALLIVAAFLSIITASQYKFFLFCVWVILIGFFIGFCYFIHETVLNPSSSPKRRRQIFHPSVHAMSDWIVSGIHDFMNDCRNEYTVLMLLSTNPAADDDNPYREMNATTNAAVHDDDNNNNNNDTIRPNDTTRPRTKLFRMMVQPLMNITLPNLRRRRRRQQRDQQHEPCTTTTQRNGSSVPDSTYIPPDDDDDTNHNRM
jgi:hypothetical protein